MTTEAVAEERTIEPWSALGGVLLSALYLSVMGWLLLAVVLPAVGFGWQPVVITSGSMQPLIRPGDVVLSGQAEEVEPGQVVTFEDPAREGTLTTHRVESVAPDGALRTRGDANTSADSTPVPPESLVGRGRLLVPMIGLPLLWLSGGLVLFGLWLIVTAISVVVLVSGGGHGNSSARGGPPRRARRQWLGRLGVLRPRTLQTAIVTRLAWMARQLHDAVYRGYRPNPSRLRRATPSTVVLTAAALFARTPATIAIALVGLVLVVLYDPDGPQLRIGRWQRVGRRTVRFVGALMPSGAAVRSVVVVVVVVAVGGSVTGRSMAAFNDSTLNAGNSFTASSAFPVDGMTLWLQNEPEGTDTKSQEYLPMTTEEPTQTVLHNYDTDADSEPGLRLKKSGQDQFEADVNKVQRWTHTLTEDFTLAAADVVFHSAMKAFAADLQATVTWYLRHCDTGSDDCVEIGQSTLSSTDWQQGSSDFVERTASVGGGSLSHVLPAGRELELVVVVPVADDDLWLAYDTVDYLSRIELTAASANVCPGTGSSVRHATGDTRVEQANPTNNYSTANELDVESHLGDNERTWLTVALSTIPDGCTLTGATLHLTTRTSSTGRTILAQRADWAVDPATVTWDNQPTTSGATGSGPSTNNGPTPLDVLEPVGELYQLGNTGLQLRDSSEDESSSSENRYHSLESRPYPSTEGPRLEVTWGP